MDIYKLMGRIASHMERQLGHESTAVVMDSICELPRREMVDAVTRLARGYGLVHDEIEIEIEATAQRAA